MAFMMPVVRKDYEIYKSNRNRRVSECSNPQSCRSKKTSECSKSEGPSLSTSPKNDYTSPVHRSVPIPISSKSSHYSHYSHNHSKGSSRTSQNSLQSPSKSSSSSPPKSNSSSSLSLFHNKLVDKLRKSFKSKDSINNGKFICFLF